MHNCDAFVAGMALLPDGDSQEAKRTGDERGHPNLDFSRILVEKKAKESEDGVCDGEATAEVVKCTQL